MNDSLTPTSCTLSRGNSLKIPPYILVSSFDTLKIGDTVDGRNPANHLGCRKPCIQWDKLPTSTGEFTGFLNHQQHLMLPTST